jgi:hypothetical protein
MQEATESEDIAMSLISLSPHRLSSRRPQLPGTAHRGPEWKSAVNLVRSALQNAVVHADRELQSADDVACRVIDHVRELDAAGLRVLLVVIGILVRYSRRAGL